VIIHIDGNLFTRLRVQHRECGTHRDGVITFNSCTEERADDTLLTICAAQVVVEDGEESGRVDGDRRSPTVSSVKNRNKLGKIEKGVLYGTRGET
jgi:hypothetical protein